METFPTEYRTPEQLEEILDSITNGNHTQAAELANEYAFYAEDLINVYEELTGTPPDTEILTRFLFLLERANELSSTH